MHQKYKDKQGKAKKWIKTRYAKPYLFELSFKSMQAAMMCSAGLSQINAVRFAQADRKQKALAIAGAYEETISGLSKIYREVKLTEARPTGK